MINIFRFSFKPEIMELITHFAKTHQYDDRKMYKEEWQKWFNANNAILDEEITRLTRIGYIGNVEYKMFNAGRYYFRKKTVIANANANANANDENNSLKEEAYSVVNTNSVVNANSIKEANNSVKAPRLYISTDKNILDAMDQHIRTSLASAAQTRTKYTPADGYNQFCKTHIPLLSKEIKRIYTTFDADTKNVAALIIQKFKKTYKNRYFTITHKC
jgi:hypothetical protein